MLFFIFPRCLCYIRETKVGECLTHSSVLKYYMAIEISGHTLNKNFISQVILTVCFVSLAVFNKLPKFPFQWNSLLQTSTKQHGNMGYKTGQVWTLIELQKYKRRFFFNGIIKNWPSSWVCGQMHASPKAASVPSPTLPSLANTWT